MQRTYIDYIYTSKGYVKILSRYTMVGNTWHMRVFCMDNIVIRRYYTIGYVKKCPIALRSDGNYFHKQTFLHNVRRRHYIQRTYAFIGAHNIILYLTRILFVRIQYNIIVRNLYNINRIILHRMHISQTIVHIIIHTCIL